MALEGDGVEVLVVEFSCFRVVEFAFVDFGFVEVGWVSYCDESWEVGGGEGGEGGSDVGGEGGVDVAPVGEGWLRDGGLGVGEVKVDFVYLEAWVGTRE